MITELDWEDLRPDPQCYADQQMKIYEIMGRNGLPNRGPAEFVEILIVTSSRHICNTQVPCGDPGVD